MSEKHQRKGYGMRKPSDEWTTVQLRKSLRDAMKKRSDAKGISLAFYLQQVIEEHLNKP